MLPLQDLKTIKRIRKVLGESNQIVINRELEVKEVVRALQQRVETAEEAAADESLLTECKSNIQEAEDDKDSLTDQVPQSHPEEYS
ncbi:hypothetical protein T484DRAFT_3143552 [Baffinella frigidus]|nr:hypothetical protein T484DRAFT_3143552 [Cryptophyta sp. CCMP2293]